MTRKVRTKRGAGCFLEGMKAVELVQELEHLLAERAVLHHAVVHGEPGLRIERIRELVRLVLGRVVVDAYQPIERDPVAVARLIHAPHGHLHDRHAVIEFREAHELGHAFVEPWRILAGELRRQVEVRVLVKDELQRRAAHGVAVHDHGVGEGSGLEPAPDVLPGLKVFLPFGGAQDHDAGRHRVLLGALAQVSFRA